MSRERKTRSKRDIREGGKSPSVRETVMGSELKVAKHVSRLPRKAAIVLREPVP